MKAPAFQFYPAEWLADANVQMASLEEEGAYIRLLCYAWREGYIPKDPQKCANLIGKGASTTLAIMVQVWFNQHPTDNTKLVHKRLEEEREKQRAWREKSASGGKKSGENRASKRGTNQKRRVVEKCLEPNGNTSSSSSSSSSSIVLSPRAEEPSISRPGEQPSQLQFRAECAKYRIPAWYADRKFDDYAVKGWKSGATPIVWREAARSWVVRDYENEGRPLNAPPASPRGKKAPAQMPNHTPGDDRL